MRSGQSAASVPMNGDRCSGRWATQAGMSLASLLLWFGEFQLWAQSCLTYSCRGLASIGAFGQVVGPPGSSHSAGAE